MPPQPPPVGARRTAGTALPVGTLTLLFTDIEGSTRLLQQAGSAYGRLLDDHRRLLRAAFDAHSGREVDTQGDSFFVAFTSPGQAVAAAAEAQQALADHTWPPPFRVRVRMGLHTGEVTEEHGSYVGVAVHLAARIAAAGHGGQILLSDATAALVRGELPTGGVLHDLGEHRLKDFATPAHLYQLDLPGLPTTFPPIRASTRRFRLPTPSGSTVGRDERRARPRCAARQPANAAGHHDRPGRHREDPSRGGSGTCGGGRTARRRRLRAARHGRRSVAGARRDRRRGGRDDATPVRTPSRAWPPPWATTGRCSCWTTSSRSSTRPATSRS